MKLLIDNALSPYIAYSLVNKGFDAVHGRDHNLQASSDYDVLDFAEAQSRIIVSADTDFGALLALRNKSQPSLMQGRGHEDMGEEHTHSEKRSEGLDL